jgi:hypothetical protein
MRPIKTGGIIATALALLASTSCLGAAFAQAASPQTAPAQAVPASTVAATSAATTTTAAQFGAVPPPASSILSVALPPYARLRWDMDVRDEDMLGVIKSFFRGFNGQSLKELLNWAKTSGMASDATTGSDKVATSGTARDLDKLAAVRLLSDADLGTMLRDINHMRVVVFEMPRSTPRRSSVTQAVPSGGTANRPALQTVVNFYEQRYLAGEGGRRMVRGDFDDVQMLTVGFPGRGFAAVFQAPGMGIVVRADGYPNFEGIGPFVMATLLRFAPPSRLP